MACRRIGPAGRKSRRAMDGLIWITHIRAGFEPLRVVGFAVNRVVTDPYVSLRAWIQGHQ
jgi:hypothetical protein